MGIDVSRFIHKKPPKDGTVTKKEALDDRNYPKVTTELQLVLQYNWFNFHDIIYKQLYTVNIQNVLFYTPYYLLYTEEYHSYQ